MTSRFHLNGPLWLNHCTTQQSNYKLYTHYAISTHCGKLRESARHLRKTITFFSREWCSLHKETGEVFEIALGLWTINSIWICSKCRWTVTRGLYKTERPANSKSANDQLNFNNAMSQRPSKHFVLSERKVWLSAVNAKQIKNRIKCHFVFVPLAIKTHQEWKCHALAAVNLLSTFAWC